MEIIKKIEFVLDIVSCEDYGDNWKRIIANSKETGKVLLALKKDCYNQLDDEKHPTKLVLTPEQMFSFEPLKSSLRFYFVSK